MPPFVFSPLLKWALIAAGGAMAVHWVVREVRRVNDEIDARRAHARIRDAESRPTLRRDPATGIYRP